MLEPLRSSVLQGKRIILASSSPRRSEILHNIGLKFEIIPSTYEENLTPEKFTNHGEFAVATAFNKVEEVEKRLSRDPIKPDLIIGADTVVSLNGKIYGKPKDKAEAYSHLQALSGKQHTVFTGVVIKTPTALRKFYESTKVFVAELDEKTIRAYIATEEPMDKAGAYGIQGYGGSIVEKIDGDYFTVMGLPLHSLCKHIIYLYK
ncbi:probable bifunctional dTTP/UTP pyrophosphatase/methyltransferase protein [Macrosteles quadrilineatus]|uniref:probable bifunctional dTTP/UTP pyrophosphatase/methyltransferase protein n=1 Tax=Macrosteles quadrilineatus TaxID=74068 RepID=UPI0023E1EB38|nr:probable bifunctional dTTP/UTP pyrophosphatase/methyltransferase protein [Macrosteles quadrilineatus]XP_054289229.1 probable bifunctional dTTP/UTP pyrophosphatase/methyltransferase protein [Macrosteles quadrilineatus]XP_054289230.1 probable bifunctional dTTP/UTP pyrophosphatase/methyltransferase protein [Macrosteles quadrilineatus]XP_054289231.1 probable bifunctional dTTP/UTP pyrophosphatase/methyltransferase protein [Macrosteles quadrilineatus]